MLYAVSRGVRERATTLNLSSPQGFRTMKSSGMSHSISTERRVSVTKSPVRTRPPCTMSSPIVQWLSSRCLTSVCLWELVLSYSYWYKLLTENGYLLDRMIERHSAGRFEILDCCPTVAFFSLEAIYGRRCSNPDIYHGIYSPNNILYSIASKALVIHLFGLSSVA